MSDAAAFPRDDRAWPPGAFTVSLVGSVAALAASASLVASADSLGRALDLLFVFVVLAGLEAAAFLDATRPWLRGLGFPSRTRGIQVALFLLVLVSFAGGPDLGGSTVCGFLAGVFLPNASVMRFARLSRGLANESEARRAQVPTDDQAPPTAAPRQVRARVIPKVGPVLRETLSLDRDRSLAWAAATMIVAITCAAAQADGAAVLGVVLLGAVALAVVVRRLAGVQRALRDFEQAAAAPRAAYVVLLHDPKPGSYRPLMGIWAKEPVPTGGHLPRAEMVYRCDSLQDALLSRQGSVVVHKAWLETNPRERRARPRWVAADAGIALPYGQSVFDRWYFASVIGSERPARARGLTIHAPNHTTEAETGTVSSVITEETRGSGRWFRLFVARLAVLALAAALFVLLT